MDRNEIEPLTRVIHHRDALLERAARLIIEAVGDDPSREGLINTPRRFRDAWIEMTTPPSRSHATFTSEIIDQMIVVRDISSWSICEHHLMPFSVAATIGTIGGECILGLSKYARIVDEECAKLSIQERLTDSIAMRIAQTTGNDDVAVILTGKHLCMCARGVRQQAATMTTSTMYGAFRNDATTRAEFLMLCR